MTSKFYEDMIGQEVKIIRGSLEDFYGKVVGFNESSMKYEVVIRLLASEIKKEFNLTDFCLKENSSNNEPGNFLFERKVL